MAIAEGILLLHPSFKIHFVIVFFYLFTIVIEIVIVAGCAPARV
jgi:hypothetical protein